jgi:hypothetical protein
MREISEDEVEGDGEDGGGSVVLVGEVRGREWNWGNGDAWKRMKTERLTLLCT